MLRNDVFGRVAAHSGVLAGATALGVMALEHTPVIGSIFALLVTMYFAAIVFLVLLRQVSSSATFWWHSGQKPSRLISTC